MAHEHTELDFGPGLTLLSGPNNTGKSAVVEALRCLVSNPTPRHYLRHGAKEARVEVELDDGVRVAWVRKKAYALYEVLRPGEQEPQVYAKFGRTPPEDIRRLLKMSPVIPEEGGKAVLDVHIGNQREPIFLLNQPGSVIASFFAASTEGAHLLAMQQALKSRVQSAKKDKKAHEGKMIALRAVLDRLSPLPAADMDLAAAQSAADRIAALEAQTPLIRKACDKLLALRTRLTNLGAQTTALAPLRPPPELHPVAPLKQWLRNQRRTRLARDRSAGRSSALARLTSPPELFPGGALAQLQKKLHTARHGAALNRSRAARLKELIAPPALAPTAPLLAVLRRFQALRLDTSEKNLTADVLQRLQSPPELFEIAPMRKIMFAGRALRAEIHARTAAANALAQLQAPPELHRLPALERIIHIGSALRRELEHKRGAANALQALQPPPQLHELDALQQRIAALKQLQARRAQVLERRNQAQETLREHQQKIEHTLEQIGACPLCGNALTMEHFLNQAHETAETPKERA